MNNDLDPILRESQVRRVTGFCRSSRFELERRGQFPARLKLTGRAVGWKTSEVKDWLEARPRGSYAAESAGP